MSMRHMNRLMLLSVSLTTVLVGATCSHAGALFKDDFEDRDIEDGDPVTWSDGGYGGILDASSGDLVVTPTALDIVIGIVDEPEYTDVRTRTRLRVSSSDFREAGVWARGIEDVGVYRVGITGDQFVGPGLAGPSQLVILKVFTDSITSLGSAVTTLDPTETDILLEFGIVGDTLSLSGWAVGDSKPSTPQVVAQDDSFPDGTTGVYFVSNRNPSTSATFRYFAVVPEPSTLALILLALSVFGGWRKWAA